MRLQNFMLWVVALLLLSVSASEDKAVRTPTPTTTPSQLPDVVLRVWADASCRTTLKGQFENYGNGKLCATATQHLNQSVVTVRLGNRVRVTSYYTNDCTPAQIGQGPYSLTDHSCAQAPTCQREINQVTGTYQLCMWDRISTCSSNRVMFPATIAECQSTRYSFGQCYTYDFTQNPSPNVPYSIVSWVGVRTSETQFSVTFYPESRNCTGLNHGLFRVPCSTQCALAQVQNVANTQPTTNALDWLTPGALRFWRGSCSTIEYQYLSLECPAYPQYYRSETLLPWNLAESACEQHQNKLAVIRSEYDQQRAYEACSQFDSLDEFNTECWLGASVNDLAINWISAGTSTFTNIAELSVGCLYMKYGGTWAVDDCTIGYASVCASTDSEANSLATIILRLDFLTDADSVVTNALQTAVTNAVAQYFAIDVPGQISVQIGNAYNGAIFPPRFRIVQIQIASTTLEGTLAVKRALSDSALQLELMTLVNVEFGKLSSRTFSRTLLEIPDITFGFSGTPSNTITSSASRSATATPTKTQTPTSSASATRTPSTSSSPQVNCELCGQMLHKNTARDTCFQGGRLPGASNLGSECVIVTLTDDVGDGWNDNTLTILSEGNLVVQLTIGEGNFLQQTVCVTGEDFTFVACGGTWHSEAHYKLEWAGRVFEGVATDDCTDLRTLHLGDYGACAICGYEVELARASAPNQCISCFSGFEIDVEWRDDSCVGYCVPTKHTMNPATDPDICFKGPCSVCLNQFATDAAKRIETWKVVALFGLGLIPCVGAGAWFLFKSHRENRELFGAVKRLKQSRKRAIHEMKMHKQAEKKLKKVAKQRGSIEAALTKKALGGTPRKQVYQRSRTGQAPVAKPPAKTEDEDMTENRWAATKKEEPKEAFRVEADDFLIFENL